MSSIRLMTDLSSNIGSNPRKGSSIMKVAKNDKSIMKESTKGSICDQKRNPEDTKRSTVKMREVMKIDMRSTMSIGSRIQEVREETLKGVIGLGIWIPICSTLTTQ